MCLCIFFRFVDCISVINRPVAERLLTDILSGRCSHNFKTAISSEFVFVQKTNLGELNFKVERKPGLL